MPQAIVPNRKAETVYNQIGSITPWVLSALYNEANRSYEEDRKDEAFFYDISLEPDTSFLPALLRRNNLLRGAWAFS